MEGEPIRPTSALFVVERVVLVMEERVEGARKGEMDGLGREEARQPRTTAMPARCVLVAR